MNLIVHVFTQFYFLQNLKPKDWKETPGGQLQWTAWWKYPHKWRFVTCINLKCDSTLALNTIFSSKLQIG